jgi:serine/threonine protein kinase
MTSPGNPSMGSPDGDTGGDVGEGEDDARQHAAEERERAEPTHHDDPDPELVKLLAQAEISFLTTGRRMSMRQSVTSVSQSPRRTTAADKLQDISITATPGAPLVAADRAAMDTPSFDDSRLEQSYSTGGDDDTIGFPQTLNSPEVSMATTYGEITPETERRSISGVNPAFGVVRRASDINNKKSAATAAVAADGKGDQRMSHTATGGDGNNSSAGNLSPIKESMVLGEEDEDDDYKLDYPASLGNSPNAYGGAVDSSYDTNGNGYPERSSPRSGGAESGQVSTSHGGDPLLGGDSEYDNDDENVAADDAVVYEDAEGGVEGLAAVNAKSKFVPIDTGGKTPVSQLDQREEKDHTSSEFSPYFFNFVARIPPKSDFYPDLHVDNISIQKPICDGSNSNIFDALMYDMPVVLKRIKASELQNEVAMSEFVRERDILSRVAHNNIICLYGAGVDSTNSHATERDRENGGEDDNDDAAIVDTSVEGNLPFLLLEPLQGNNLKALIHRKRAFFSTPFTYPQFLILASQLADAINYLHNDFNPSCIIIHRDIKPDNIGFAADGTLKLMDFGLSICIKRHPGENDKSHGGKGKGKGKDKGKRNKKQMLPTYMMTGETGSLRYMAPEVALTTPYNERVDIYSFGLVLYEMLTGVAPYGGISKDEFYTRVIEGGERPPTDMDDYGRRIRADTQILQLIERCWSANPQFRPDAEDILAVVNAVQDTKKKGGSDGKSGDCVIS